MEDHLNEDELNELLLYSSRNGDINLVKELLTAASEGKISVDINSKGKLVVRGNV